LGIVLSGHSGRGSPLDYCFYHLPISCLDRDFTGDANDESLTVWVSNGGFDHPAAFKNDYSLKKKERRSDFSHTILTISRHRGSVSQSPNLIHGLSDMLSLTRSCS
jgi:hypothetical protein